MLFPVEVIADGPKEILEIRNVISQLVSDRLYFMRFADHVMSGGSELLQQAIHVLHDADHLRQVGGLHEQVIHALFLERHDL